MRGGRRAEPPPDDRPTGIVVVARPVIIVDSLRRCPLKLVAFTNAPRRYGMRVLEAGTFVYLGSRDVARGEEAVKELIAADASLIMSRATVVAYFIDDCESMKRTRPLSLASRHVCSDSFSVVS